MALQGIRWMVGGVVVGALLVGGPIYSKEDGWRERPEVKRFSEPAEIRDSMTRLWESQEDYRRLYENFLSKSNLGDLDPGTNRNPSTFVGDGWKTLPPDAKITLTLTRDEFQALGLPTWESVALGGPNHFAFVKAWVAFQEYENARLRLALLEAGSPEAGPLNRRELEAIMTSREKQVLEYLNTEPAD